MAMTVDEDVTPSSPRLKELWQEKTLGGDTNYMEHRYSSMFLSILYKTVAASRECNII